MPDFMWISWNSVDFSMKFGGFYTKDHFARDGKAYVLDCVPIKFIMSTYQMAW